MLTPVAPSTSNINDRLQCRRHLKAEEVMRLIADIYDRPSVDFRNKADRTGQRRRAAHSAKTSGFRNLSILEAQSIALQMSGLRVIGPYCGCPRRLQVPTPR